MYLKASGHEMKFYLEPTLETNDFEVALLHVSMNDILKIDRVQILKS